MDQMESAGVADVDGTAAAPDRFERPSSRSGDWVPPATREDAEEQILVLSTDIGMILAQLAEDTGAWCERTGRSAADHAQWRRRALFAKVHKEHQLRECKRVRVQLAGQSADPEPHREPELSVSELASRSRCVVNAWACSASAGDRTALDSAVQHLADYLDPRRLVESEAAVRVLGVADV